MQRAHEKQTPGRPKCFSSPSGGRAPHGGDLGGPRFLRRRSGLAQTILTWLIACLVAWLLACAPLALAGAVSAPSADPTRPPQGMTGNGPAGNGQPGTARAPATGAARAGAPASAPPTPAAPPQLQAVQLPATGPATALVDGVTVQVGDRVGEHKVLAIDALGLLLQTTAAPRRLWLLDGAAKQAVGSLGAARMTRYEPAMAPTPTLAPATAQQPPSLPQALFKPITDDALSKAPRTTP